MTLTERAGTAPAARLDWVRTVVDDGWHNAVTHLARWRGQLWLCFRRAESHGVEPPGEVVVLSSADGLAWRERAVFHSGGDDRDPKLLADGEGLRVFWGATRTAPNDDEAAGARVPRERWVESYSAATVDGDRWTEPLRVVDAGWWLWSVTRCKDGYFGVAYGSARGSGATEVAVTLWRSADAERWEQVTQLLEPGRGNEGALHRASPTRLVALVRGHGETLFMESEDAEARFETWTSRTIPHWMHAPVLLPWRDTLLVAGRDRAPASEVGEQHDYRTCLWRVDDGRIEKLLTLPSGGDTSYCGLIPDGDDAVLVSYYSQHEFQERENFVMGEKPAAIYLARVVL